MDSMEQSNNEFHREHDENTQTQPIDEKSTKLEIVYVAVIAYLIIHASALYGAYLCFNSAKWTTILFAYLLYVFQILGISGGSHRLWSHRSYKANTPLQILLMLMTTLSFQWTVADWVRNHRMHHKHTDTNADPLNAKRGAFFSHIGWLLTRKHPDVKRLGKELDMSDIDSNRVLRFQKKFAVPMFTIFCFVLPTVIPMYLWGESLSNAWFVATMLRWVMGLHSVFVVNSVGHTWGYRPYDKSISPTDNSYIAFMTLGENSHNYHHAFPNDYRSAEIGHILYFTNMTSKFIDFFAWIGWAYDLRTVSESVVEKRVLRTGETSERFLL